MSEEFTRILPHYPNSGIVQMPGRRFPGIVMQGDSLSSLHAHIKFALDEAKRRRDEEAYYELLHVAHVLEDQLMHYEHVLDALATPYPYPTSIRERVAVDDFDDDVDPR